MSPMTRRQVAAALIGLIVLAATFASIGLIAAARPADAHASVSSTEPRADSRITALPDRVVIHVLKKQATRAGDPILVFDPDGVRIDAGDPVISDLGATISVGLRAGSRRSGTYNVVYKITSADTHVIYDRFSFSLAPMSNETAPAPTGGEVRTDAPSALAATTGRLRVVGPPGGSYLGVGLVFLALVTLLVMAFRRRRHRDDAGEPGFRVVTTGEHRLGPVAGTPLPPQRTTPLTAAPSVALPATDWSAPPSGEWPASASGEWPPSASGEWPASASGEWTAPPSQQNRPLYPSTGAR
jgi:methionine-rich copper-binding protein CopC